jgi:hypothetical protein
VHSDHGFERRAFAREIARVELGEGAVEIVGIEDHHRLDDSALVDLVDDRHVDLVEGRREPAAEQRVSLAPDGDRSVDVHQRAGLARSSCVGEKLLATRRHAAETPASVVEYGVVGEVEKLLFPVLAR